MRRTIVGLLAAACVLASCTSDPAPPAPAPAEETSDDETSDGPPALLALEVAAAAGADPVTIALTRFALQFGPVPGALSFAPDDTLPLAGSGAVAGIAAVWDDLDDAQRTAVRERLAPWRDALDDAAPIDLDGDDVAIAAPAAGALPPPLPASVDERVAAELRRAYVHVFGRLGGAQPAVLRVVQSDTPLAAGDAVTRAGWLTALPGALELIFDDTVTTRDCEMVLGPVVPGLPDDMLRSLAAHELFHCWSVLNAGTLTAHNATPGWYQEGLASWVGEDHAGGSGYSTEWWRLWLQPAQRPIFSTEYPAIGFWSWLDAQRGGDLLTRIPSLHAVAVRGDAAALFTAAVQGLGDEALSGLAASRSRAPDRGPAWDLEGPGITADAVDADPPLGIAEAGVQVAARALEVRTGTYARPGGDPIALTATTTGPARLWWSDGTEVVATGSTTTRWCLVDPCECPDGTAVLGLDPLPADAEVLTVAATGTAAGPTTVDVRPEDPCEEPSDAASTETVATGGLVGTWHSQPASVVAEAEELFADMDASATYESGRTVLTFREDGTVEVVHDLVLRLSPGEDQPSLPLEITGGGVLGYRVDGGTIRFTPGEFSVVFRLAGVDGALTVDDDDVGDGGPTSAVWGVSGGTLTLQTETSDVFLPNRYRRP